MNGKEEIYDKMIENIDDLFMKTYIVNDIGLYINDEVIPKGSICGFLGGQDDKVKMDWITDEGLVKVMLDEKEFVKLIYKEIIEDIIEVKKPPTQSKFKVGQLVKVYKFSLLVDTPIYNFVKNEWEYKLRVISDNLEIEKLDTIYPEEIIEPVNEFETDVIIGNFEYVLTIREK